MRVLQVNSVYGRGSTGRIVEEIGASLNANGHDGFVAYGRGNAPTGNGFIRVGNGRDVLQHGVRSRVLDQHGLGSVNPTEALVQRIKEVGFDVIHLHNIHGYYLNYEVLFEYTKSAAIPLIWTLHDCWPFTGHCAFFTYVECDKWRSHCHNCPQKAAYPTSIARDNSYENFERKRDAFAGQDNLTVVTPSHWLANLASASTLAEYPTRVIPNDPNLDAFKPVQSKWKRKMGLEGMYVILGVANYWEHRKGLHFLENLAPELRPDEVVVIVGNVPRGTKLPERFLHIRATEDIAELAAIYTASDVYVNPTLEDNYPTTNLEAMACGTPAITFDTGGSGETISRGHGRVLTEKTSAALRAAIDDLRATPLASSSMAEKHTLLRPSDVTMSQQYLKLYEEVLA